MKILGNLTHIAYCNTRHLIKSHWTNEYQYYDLAIAKKTKTE